MIMMRIGFLVGLTAVLASAGCSGAEQANDPGVAYEDSAPASTDGTATAPVETAEEKGGLAPSYFDTDGAQACYGTAKSHCEAKHAPGYFLSCDIVSSYYSPTGACVYSYRIFDLSDIGPLGGF